MSSKFYVGYTDNILSAIHEKEDNNKEIKSNINIIPDKKIIGASVSAMHKIRSGDSLVAPNFSVGADTKTGVLVSGSSHFKKENSHGSENFSAKLGYNFGTSSSIGKVVETDITTRNKFGDETTMHVGCHGNNAMIGASWKNDIAKLKLSGGNNSASASISTNNNRFNTVAHFGNESGEFRFGFNFGFSM